jgi:NADH pyrophosphatase NudC (nudix superfamily)
MPNEPPEYCGYCGSELRPVDPPSAHYCNSCEEYVFYNPVPAARLAVLDGGSILLGRVNLPDRQLWATPGGMVEAGEDPGVAGARELEEEMGLDVSPADLVLFDARTFVKFEATHKTSLCYAVDAADVTGTPEPLEEVMDARYWTVEEFRASSATLGDGTNVPEAHADLRWWVEEGQRALERVR